MTARSTRLIYPYMDCLLLHDTPAWFACGAFAWIAVAPRAFSSEVGTGKWGPVRVKIAPQYNTALSNQKNARRANYTLPLTWTANENEGTETALPLLDPSDKTLIDFISAIRDFTDREKRLALLLIHTISTWSMTTAEI